MNIFSANKFLILAFVSLILFFSSCNHKKTLFTRSSPGETGVHFINHIEDSDSLNILDYLYYYNGGGVAIGDINNDGLADIYFSSNTGSNKLYLNKGELRFEDITNNAGVNGKGNWKTGVTIIDINGDGLQDIYVCEVGKYKNLVGRNELFINNGNLTFIERAHEYGLDAEGFNTQAVFFDYDNDGDLDMFLVNHSVHSTDTYVKSEARTIKNEWSGDKLFRNDKNHFTEVTEQAGIYSSIIGYGLNAVTGDLNNDGWQDIYVSNDFHENDYYYLNQKDGTFKEINKEAFGHESRFSMGSDMADMNNDGWLDIITLDMLPPGEKLNKMSAGEDPPDIFAYKLSYGYHYQYARNCFQLNMDGGKHFSDIALYSGIAATDWSWSPLAADFDNDGIKDLFITNGILRRPNDLDYLKFSSADYYGAAHPGVSKLDAIKKMPDGKQSNYIFKGTDSLKFDDKSVDWGISQLSYSNGAAYADLDNDGDLDIITNNINEPAFIFRNNSIEQKINHFIEVEVKGYGLNPFAIGTKIIVRQNVSFQMTYINATKGFESSSLQYAHFGLGDATNIDTLQVIWPDGKTVTLTNVKGDQKITVDYPSSISQAGSSLTSVYPISSPIFLDITDSISLPFIHRENDFNDFGIQPLLLHKVSTEGPKIAVADINGDGIDDFFVCGAKGQPGSLFVQMPDGKFLSTNKKIFEAGSECEDVNAVFFDADKDGDNDLYVVSGGNETEGNNTSLQDRLYINDGKGNFSKSAMLPEFYGNKSAVAVTDIDNDGDQDIFVGGRCVAGKYGNKPVSYLLLNDGKGKFVLADEATAPGLKNIGMVTGAVWADIDHDGWRDLIIVGEWMPVTVFKNEKGRLKNITVSVGLQHTTGLWTTIYKTDINNDGYDDLLIGNWGQNSKLKASETFPLKMFAGDFNRNGNTDPIVAKAENEIYYPFLGKDELEKRFPAIIRKIFFSYNSFASQSVYQVFGEKIKQASEFNAAELSSVLLLNNRKSGFLISRLPYQVQWTPVFSFLTDDFNDDGKQDILSGGNFWGSQPYEGRYDAGYPVLLTQKDSAMFSPVIGKGSGININGEIRDIKLIHLVGNRKAYLFAVNNNRLIVIQHHSFSGGLP